MMQLLFCFLMLFKVSISHIPISELVCSLSTTSCNCFVQSGLVSAYHKKLYFGRIKSNCSQQLNLSSKCRLLVEYTSGNTGIALAFMAQQGFQGRTRSYKRSYRDPRGYSERK